MPAYIAVFWHMAVFFNCALIPVYTPHFLTLLTHQSKHSASEIQCACIMIYPGAMLADPEAQQL